MSAKVVRIILEIVTLLLIAILLAMGITHSPAPVVASAKAGQPTGQSASPAFVPNCGSAGWALEHTPINGNWNSSIRAISSSDVWTVGFYRRTDTWSKTLTEHWDGNAWSIIPGADPGWNNLLSDVDGIASNDVWAVGAFYASEEGTPSQFLIIHWNGIEWTTSAAGPDFTSLSKVDALSADDVWAVGTVSRTSAMPLVMHWNGSQWTQVEGYTGQRVNAIAAISANDVWLAGDVINHWDGTSWHVVAQAGTGDIAAMSAVSSNDIYAVGDGVQHWNGTAWSIIPSPNVDDFRGVDAIAPNDVWAISGDQSFRWNGTGWTTMQFSTMFLARDFDALSDTDVWAVGDWYTPVVERFNPIPCTPTPIPTPSATPVPPRCPSERFTDVCPGDYYYQPVLNLNDISVVSGYSSAPPCDGPASIPCFKPYNLTTRGQVAKILAIVANFNEPVSGQGFEDVPPGHTFYEYVQRMASRGIINGYPCGGPGEPCGPQSLPYFRVGGTVNRAQLSKMSALTFGFDNPPNKQTFEDVVPENHFYPFIENLAARQIINGYPCGGPGEPCGTESLPYFRYGNPITRGQVSKIVDLARLQPTATPTSVATSTHDASPTPTLTMEPTSTPTSTPESR